MSTAIHVLSCAAHAVRPLIVGAAKAAAMPAHRIDHGPLPAWRVGTSLSHAGKPVFCVVGRLLLPDHPHAQLCPLLQAVADIPEAIDMCVDEQRVGRALAWITLSDKGHAGQREDLSGPAIDELVRAHVPLCHSQGFMLPDNAAALKALLLELALGQGYDIICTTGGTGIGPRDFSPEATLAVVEKRLPGFEQAMMQASLAQTPRASISRAVAGVVGQSIIINTPGSRKAVVENLSALVPALAHALDKLHGDPADCGG
ncbi:MAG: MogA/MoaB family molybdenum cofactor biosynthesis protein [Desulfovibrionaceae bacterium]